MAKVTYSSLVTGLSGSVGKATFSGSGSNAIVRSKPYNSHFNSKNQLDFLALRPIAYASWIGLLLRQQLFVQMFISLYPRYLLSNGGLAKSAQFHYIRWYMYLKASGWTPSLSSRFDNPLVIDFVPYLRFTGGKLWVYFPNPLPLGVVPVIFVGRVRGKELASEQNNVSLCKSVSSHTSAEQDINDSYVSKYGIAPSVGSHAWLGLYLMSDQHLHISNYFITYSFVY